MLLQGNQGQTGKAVGQGQTIGFGEFTEALFTGLMPRYYETNYRGQLFTASSQGAVAVTHLTATATGFILSNPAGSGKNLVLVELLFAQDLAAAAAIDVISLAAVTNPQATATVHTTPLTVQSGVIGGSAASVAKADSAATLGATPVIVRTLYANSISATATTAVPPFVKDEIAGALIIAPGCSVAVDASTATSAQVTMS